MWLSFQGRSPAVSLIVLYLYFKSELIAKQELKKIRPKALPNKRIIKLADLLLNSKLEMVNEEIWKERIEMMILDIGEINLSV